LKAPGVPLNAALACNGSFCDSASNSFISRMLWSSPPVSLPANANNPSAVTTHTSATTIRAGRNRTPIIFVSAMTLPFRNARLRILR
jgi:hypothetical protein